MTPEEYRLLRLRRASEAPPVAPRKCASCGVGATLAGSPYCGVCALAREILGKTGTARPE